MSVTLQIRLNGGAPQTGGVTGAIGDVVQLTAANKSTWNGAARWEIYDYPPSFTVPSGWSTDSDGVFYALGNADPPAFTISGATNWGKYGFRVTVLDGAVLTTDDATALSIPSAGGIKSIMAGESSQFGGTREAWVRDLKADIRALAAGGGGGGSGTVTPDPDELVKRDGFGAAYATSFVGPAGAAAALTAQGANAVSITSGAAVNVSGGASADITLDSARDVILDVGSTSDEISIRAGNVVKATITPGALITTIASAQPFRLESSSEALVQGPIAALASTAGDAATLRASSGAVVIGDGDESDALTITPNGSGGTTTIAAFQPMSIGAAGAMTVQPAQAVSGAGFDYIFGGGPGQTPGTHLAGNTIVDLGTLAAGESAKLSIRAGGSEQVYIKREAAGGGRVFMVPGAGNSFWASIRGLTSSALAVDGECTFRYLDTAFADLSNREAVRVIRGSLITTTAGAQNVLTRAIPSNFAEVFLAYFTVTNKTSKAISHFAYRFRAGNNAGTGYDEGAATTIVADALGTGEAGLSCTIDRSGTTARLRVDTPDTTQREIRCYVFVSPSALT